jgi:hypothetical protein
MVLFYVYSNFFCVKCTELAGQAKKRRGFMNKVE